MANNFEVRVTRTGSSGLHLKLAGDFDADSAYRLQNIISDEIRNPGKITLDTSALKSIHPYGSGLFRFYLKSFLDNRLHIDVVGRARSAFANVRNTRRRRILNADRRPGKLEPVRQ